MTLNITDRALTAGSGTIDPDEDIAQHGEGMATADMSTPVATRTYHVAVSGRSFGGARGVGDTSATADAHGHKTLRDPGWLILGHEMCGHVRKDLSTSGSRDFIHTQSEDYATSAIDVENAIRREHSSTSDDLGIRFGTFGDFEGNSHLGSVYEIKLGARVITLHNKFNIPYELMTANPADGMSDESYVNCNNRPLDVSQPQRVYKHVFAHRPDQPVAYILSGCDNHHFGVGEKVFLEGVFPHRVIAGETKTSIARMWNVTLDRLFVANQHINNLDTFTPTATLPVGMSVIIPYDRRAASVFFTAVTP